MGHEPRETWAETVSYTHLDVYKRQVKHPVAGSAVGHAPAQQLRLSGYAQRSGVCAGGQHHGFPAEDPLTGFQELGNRRQIHAEDVYKRQIKKVLSLTTPLEVAAIVAFGYGEKTAKKLRLNILSMSHYRLRL